jgi:hypothetical protein
MGSQLSLGRALTRVGQQCHRDSVQACPHKLILDTLVYTPRQDTPAPRNQSSRLVGHSRGASPCEGARWP